MIKFSVFILLLDFSMNTYPNCVIFDNMALSSSLLSKNTYFFSFSAHLIVQNDQILNTS